ncbi:hypothetical protein AAMO2058_000110900 [Amorphochlora amoebiformis]
MKLRHLQSMLEDVKSFSDPKYNLEQYSTSPHLAASMIFSIEQSYGDITGKNVADLGCGCGMLTIAAACMGARLSIGFDVDVDALGICHQNLTRHDIEAKLIHSDIRALLLKLLAMQRKEEDNREGEESGETKDSNGDVHGTEAESARTQSSDEALITEIQVKLDKLGLGDIKPISRKRRERELGEQGEKELGKEEGREKEGGEEEGGKEERGEEEEEKEDGGGEEGEEKKGEESEEQGKEEEGEGQEERKAERVEETEKRRSKPDVFDISTLPKIDTVLMNPPFGTRSTGIDMVFLETAIRLTQKSVYSLHKTSTRKHILKKASEWGVDVKVIAELRFDIPNMYKFHRKKSVDIEVDLIRCEKLPGKSLAIKGSLDTLFKCFQGDFAQKTKRLSRGRGKSSSSRGRGRGRGRGGRAQARGSNCGKKRARGRGKKNRR